MGLYKYVKVSSYQRKGCQVNEGNIPPEFTLKGKFLLKPKLKRMHTSLKNTSQKHPWIMHTSDKWIANTVNK